MMDDYGTEVFDKCIRTGIAPLWATQARWMKSYYPGVRKTWPVHVSFTREMELAEIASFHENDANCNTCRNLIRVKFKRNSPASPMPGVCGLDNSEFMFHPDDWMGKKCWQARA